MDVCLRTKEQIS